MRAVVLKSHWWPTTGAVHYLRALRPSSVELFASVTLNAVAGGAEPWVVDSAAQQGARVVFLPTWSAAGDLASGRWTERLRSAIPTFDASGLVPYRCVDDDGTLTRGARELLALCRDRGLTLGTGHVSWQESLALVAAANDLGHRRLVFSHPLSRGVAAPVDAVRRAADGGAWIELCAINMARGRTTAAEAVAWCRTVGVDRIVLSTDAFRAEDPPPPELLRDSATRLLAEGLGADELRRMVAAAPALALGLD